MVSLPLPLPLPPLLLLLLLRRVNLRRQPLSAPPSRVAQCVAGGERTCRASAARRRRRRRC